MDVSEKLSKMADKFLFMQNLTKIFDLAKRIKNPYFLYSAFHLILKTLYFLFSFLLGPRAWKPYELTWLLGPVHRSYMNSYGCSAQGPRPHEFTWFWAIRPLGRPSGRWQFYPDIQKFQKRKLFYPDIQISRNSILSRYQDGHFIQKLLVVILGHFWTTLNIFDRGI